MLLRVKIEKMMEKCEDDIKTFEAMLKRQKKKNRDNNNEEIKKLENAMKTVQKDFNKKKHKLSRPSWIRLEPVLDRFGVYLVSKVTNIH